jgi:hypothetical protein
MPKREGGFVGYQMCWGTLVQEHLKHLVSEYGLQLFQLQGRGDAEHQGKYLRQIDDDPFGMVEAMVRAVREAILTLSSTAINIKNRRGYRSFPE